MFSVGKLCRSTATLRPCFGPQGGERADFDCNPSHGLGHAAPRHATRTNGTRTTLRYPVLEREGCGGGGGVGTPLRQAGTRPTRVTYKLSPPLPFLSTSLLSLSLPLSPSVHLPFLFLSWRAAVHRVVTLPKHPGIVHKRPGQAMCVCVCVCE